MLERIATNIPDGTALGEMWVPATYVGGAGSATYQSALVKLTTAAVGGFAAAARTGYKRPLTNGEFSGRITPGQTWIQETFLSLGLGDGPGTANQPANGWDLNFGGNLGSLGLSHQIAGVETVISTPNYVYTASNPVRFRFRKIGLRIMWKVWDDTTVEPNWSTADDTAGPLSSTLFPFIGVNTGTAATAETFSFDQMVLSDLRQAPMLLVQSAPPSAPVSPGFFVTGVAA